MKRRNSSALPPVVPKPCRPGASRSDGMSITFCVSALSLPSAASGVPPGAASPHQTVIQRVTGHLPVQAGIDAVRADRRHQQRVAVGRLARPDSAVIRPV